jgi:hypothetical protein
VVVDGKSNNDKDDRPPNDNRGTCLAGDFGKSRRFPGDEEWWDDFGVGVRLRLRRGIGVNSCCFDVLFMIIVFFILFVFVKVDFAFKDNIDVTSLSSGVHTAIVDVILLLLLLWFVGEPK